MEDKSDDFKDFMQQSEWFYYLGRLRRKPMHGIVVEIADAGNGFCQPIIDPDGISRAFRHDGHPKKCKNLEEAKEYAWVCLSEVLQALPGDEGARSVKHAEPIMNSEPEFVPDARYIYTPEYGQPEEVTALSKGDVGQMGLSSWRIKTAKGGTLTVSGDRLRIKSTQP